MAFSVFEMMQALNQNMNPKFAHTLSGTIADERRHVGFGENRIGSLLKQHPERKPEIEKMGAEHALTLEELIRAYTINAAWVLRLEDVTGSIEPGKYADMIVLNHNLFEIPATDIHKTDVQKTIFKGEVVYNVE